MAEKNLDFDTVIDRRNTDSLKYDFAKRRGMPEGLLSLWVADMDFKISSYIQDALMERVEHGIFGYSETKEEYFEAVKGWMKEQYSWDVEEKWLVKTPGVVFALAMAVKAFTTEGDNVLIQLPVYYPFSEVILDNKRKIVSNTLIQDENGEYHMDFEDFEEKIVSQKIKLFILCSPHNPVGRVWTEEELNRIGEICHKHQVIVVSDEIHADFVFKGKHHVFANLSEKHREITITCTSPSKTFNLAGLQLTNVFIANPTLKRAFRKEVDAAGYSQLNAMGLIAGATAYRSGGEWYQSMLAYVKANMEYCFEFVNKEIPNVSMNMPEGTYLAWLDFRQLNLSDDELDKLIIKEAKLWLDSGKIFGESGSGFQRINVACPRVILEQALNQLASAVKNHLASV